MNEIWVQNYYPINGSFAWSVVAAIVPVGVLLTLLAVFRVRAHLAALWGLAAALAIATMVYGMPARLAVAAAGYGALYGLLPISWIVVNAIFVFEISVTTGSFERVKATLAHQSSDARIQVLLVAFCFGAFIEGAAGFGTPVAISGAILIGLGCPPAQAAILALVGNTAPVAFGALGSPILALAQVTGLPLHDLSAMVGRQLPFFSVIIPFWLVAMLSGYRGIRETWPACLVTGFGFGVAQYIVSNWHGPWLVDILSAFASAFGLLLLLRIWRPRTPHQFSLAARPSNETGHQDTAGTAMAWAPWLLLAGFVFLWGLPVLKAKLDAIFSVRLPIPWLHTGVARGAPIVQEIAPEPALFVFNLLSATGSAILLAGLISGGLFKIGVKQLVRLYLATLWRVRFSIVTICAMLALAFTTRFAGIDVTLGLAFASSGVLFPFFAALLGWLGVALTGSDTSSNVLFGNLQVTTAQQVGMSPLLAAAANSSGGVMGKMIDAQSIVVASAATRHEGAEGVILRKVFGHSLVLAAMVGILVFLQAYIVPWMVP